MALCSTFSSISQLQNPQSHSLFVHKLNLNPGPMGHKLSLQGLPWPLNQIRSLHGPPNYLCHFNYDLHSTIVIAALIDCFTLLFCASREPTLFFPWSPHAQHSVWDVRSREYVLGGVSFHREFCPVIRLKIVTVRQSPSWKEGWIWTPSLC